MKIYRASWCHHDQGFEWGWVVYSWLLLLVWLFMNVSLLLWMLWKLDQYYLQPQGLTCFLLCACVSVCVRVRVMNVMTRSLRVFARNLAFGIVAADPWAQTWIQQFYSKAMGIKHKNEPLIRSPQWEHYQWNMRVWLQPTHSNPARTLSRVGEVRNVYLV